MPKRSTQVPCTHIWGFTVVRRCHRQAGGKAVNNIFRSHIILFSLLLAYTDGNVNSFNGTNWNDAQDNIKRTGTVIKRYICSKGLDARISFRRSFKELCHKGINSCLCLGNPEVGSSALQKVLKNWWQCLLKIKDKLK